MRGVVVMKFLGVLSQYRALSPEQRSFIKNAQRKFVGTPEELLTFFKPMAVFDKSLDDARSQLLTVAILCFVLTFVGIIGVAILAEDYPFVIVLEILVFLMIFAAAILRWMLGKIDIHNNLREFIVPIINLVGQDMPAGQKIAIDLDLRGKTIDGKLKDTRKDNPGWFSYPKVTTRIYEDPWFRLNGQLVDGSRLMLNVDDQITRIDKTYKGMSGKIKSKTKYKVKHAITASLALRHKKYAIATETDIKNLGAGAKFKDGDNRQLISLKRTLKTDDIEKNLDPHTCISLLGQIFMNIQPAAQRGA